MVRFDLPDILIAERVGRALALQLTDRRVEAVVNPSLEGAAALAAIRHAVNFGFTAQVSLLQADAAQSCEAFAIMLEIVGCMDLPVRALQSPDSAGTAELVIDGTDAGVSIAISAEELFQVDDVLHHFDDYAWDRYVRTFGEIDNPFLSDARKEDALARETICAIDRKAIEEFSVPGVCLMENAGIGGAVVAAQMLDHHSGSGGVVVLAGYGNNGGDGFVVARGLIEKGVAVRVLTLGDPARLTGDAKTNFEILTQRPGVVETISDERAVIDNDLSGASLIVDGLFGTGLTRVVEGRAAAVVEAVNAASAPVLSLDIPSGLQADTGAVMGVCVRADETVTFAAPKIGFWSDAGPTHCGRITLARIGCPRACFDSASQSD